MRCTSDSVVVSDIVAGFGAEPRGDRQCRRFDLPGCGRVLLSEQSGISPELIEPVYRYTVLLSALITVFELSVIYFFTRPKVVNQFRRRGSVK